MYGLEGFNKWSRKGFYKQENIPKGMPEVFINDFKIQKGRYSLFQCEVQANVFTDDFGLHLVSPKGLRYAEMIASVLAMLMCLLP